VFDQTDEAIVSYVFGQLSGIQKSIYKPVQIVAIPLVQRQKSRFIAATRFAEQFTVVDVVRHLVLPAEELLLLYFITR
jgi:hypothetical protein